LLGYVGFIKSIYFYFLAAEFKSYYSLTYAIFDRSFNCGLSSLKMPTLLLVDNALSTLLGDYLQ
jgi:hypothetical protein